MNRLAPFAVLLTALATLVVSALAVTPDAPPPDAPPPADEPRASKVCALLVGAGRYPELANRPEASEFTELLGPANDVDLMRATLQRALGAAQEDIVALSGWDDADPDQRPTKANVVRELERLAERVEPGDLAVVLLAGHGTQVPDGNADEADELDEVFLPSDVEPWNEERRELPNALVDDELGALLAPIRAAGARVWLIVDACHAGTMMRGERASVRYRTTRPRELGVPVARRRPIDRRSGLDVEGPEVDARLDAGAGFVATYAAHSDQGAPEEELPRGSAEAAPHGKFTFMLCRELSLSRGRATYSELIRRVRAAYLSSGELRAVPWAEGTDLHATVLEGAASGSGLFVEEKGGRLVVDAGLLQDVGVGTRLAVYDFGRRGDADALRGYVEVTRAGLLRAACEVSIEGEEPAPSFERGRPLPAEIDSMQFSDQPLRLGVRTPDGHWTESVEALPAEARAAFEKLGARAELVPVERAGWILELAADWRIASADGDALFGAAQGELCSALVRIYRVQNLRELARRLDRRAKGIELHLEVDGERIEPGARVTPGKAQLVVTAPGPVPLEVWLFYVGQDFALTLLTKLPNLPIDLSKKGEAATEVYFTDEELGTTQILAIVAPPGSMLGKLAQAGLHPPGEMRSAGRDPYLADLVDLLFGDDQGRVTRSAPSRATSVGMLSIDFETTWDGAEMVATDDEVVFQRPSAALGALPLGEEEPSFRADRSKLRGSELVSLYRRVAPAIVALRTDTGYGTGFLVEDDGERLLVTNHHVVSDGTRYSPRGRRTVRVLTGRLEEGGMRVVTEPLEAEILRVDPLRDLALLRLVEEPEWLASVEPIPLSSSAPTTGQTAVIIGHPSGGMLWSLREGRVSQSGDSMKDLADAAMSYLGVDGPAGDEAQRELEELDDTRVVLTNCGANSGDSGGPLVDQGGRLLGVTVAIPANLSPDGSEYNPGFTYHVHVEELAAFLAERREDRAREDQPDVPDPWDIGPEITAPLDARGRAFALRGSSADEEQLLLDLGPGTPCAGDEAPQKYFARTFDWELAIHSNPRRLTAFYDTDDDGVFDLVFEDYDPDRTADARFELTDAGWQFELGDWELVQVARLEPVFRLWANRPDAEKQRMTPGMFEDQALSRMRRLIK